MIIAVVYWITHCQIILMTKTQLYINNHRYIAHQTSHHVYTSLQQHYLNHNQQETLLLLIELIFYSNDTNPSKLALTAQFYLSVICYYFDALSATLQQVVQITSRTWTSTIWYRWFQFLHSFLSILCQFGDNWQCKCEWCVCAIEHTAMPNFWSFFKHKAAANGNLTCKLLKIDEKHIV